jgi:hypothetical protein
MKHESRVRSSIAEKSEIDQPTELCLLETFESVHAADVFDDGVVAFGDGLGIVEQLNAAVEVFLLWGEVEVGRVGLLAVLVVQVKLTEFLKVLVGYLQLGCHQLDVQMAL